MLKTDIHNLFGIKASVFNSRKDYLETAEVLSAVSKSICNNLVNAINPKIGITSHMLYSSFRLLHSFLFILTSNTIFSLKVTFEINQPSKLPFKQKFGKLRGLPILFLLLQEVDICLT
jgi:hypothetical protein